MWGLPVQAPARPLPARQPRQAAHSAPALHLQQASPLVPWLLLLPVLPAGLLQKPPPVGVPGAALLLLLLLRFRLLLGKLPAGRLSPLLLLPLLLVGLLPWVLQHQAEQMELPLAPEHAAPRQLAHPVRRQQQQLAQPVRRRQQRQLSG